MKNRIINSLLFLVVMTAFGACALEKTIELDLKQTEKKLIIDALLTDSPDKTPYVILSNTVDFYTTGRTPRVSDADVVIVDNLGNEFVMEEQEDAPGVYTNDFRGVIGRTYTLSVTYEGQIYESTETLARVTAIDSLTWSIDPDELEDPEDEGYFYEMLLYTTEPTETEDFYLFKFYRNDSIMNFDGEGVFFSDDEYLSENIEGVTGPGYYREGDKGTMEMYSMSRSGFVYFQDMDMNLNNDGGMFGPIPANSRNNLSNGALGFFLVSAVSIDSIRIGE
ncbi:DUF4249 domain-containing protein [Flammeovirgaceae bacterium SG7u.111]|nr:DUF4249 domain-containing protein [Flammeovirgaceae bacterium SG7u.132]WPO38491.1 DUF4249 domain-containing protein [Flammeovirgaceae bacterium SG7u.111]